MTTGAFESIGYQVEGPAAIVTLNRPERRNALSLGLMLELTACLEEIGGEYVPQPYGGPDWHAEIKARMHRWTVQTFAELKVFHHRPTGGVEGLLKSHYRRGLMEYSFGSHPAFELFKVARRVTASTPYGLGAATMLYAFLLAHCRRERRCVSEDVVRFLRREQLARLKEFAWPFAKAKSAVVTRAG